VDLRGAYGNARSVNVEAGGVMQTMEGMEGTVDDMRELQYLQSEISRCNTIKGATGEYLPAMSISVEREDVMSCSCRFLCQMNRTASYISDSSIS
jgi:hypothetical protein